MAIKDLYIFDAELTSFLKKTDKVLPIGGAKINELTTILSHNDWAYLTIYDGIHFEVVKVGNFNNEIYIERGIEGTIARNFPAGSCVKHTLTLKAVADYISALPKCD